MNFMHVAKHVCVHRGKTPITLSEKAPRIFIRCSNDASWQPRYINLLLYLYLFLQIGTVVAKDGTVVANLHEFPKKHVGWQPINIFHGFLTEGS